MISLILFVFAAAVIGWLVVKIFTNGLLNNFEAIGASFGLGLLVNAINLFILSILNIKISLAVFWIFLLVEIAVLCAVAFLRKSLIFKNPTFEKPNIFEAGLMGALFTIILSYFYSSLSSGLSLWDEFSFWGKAAKMIFLNQTLFIQKAVNIDFGGYPTFWPASLASVSFAANSFNENYIRVLSPILLVFFCFFLYGILSRYKFARSEKLAFLILLLASGQIFASHAFTAYAEVITMYFVGLGTFLAFFGFKESENNLIIFSSILFAGLSLVKPYGFLLAFCVYGALILTDKFKDIKNYIIPVLITFAPVVLSAAVSRYLNIQSSPYSQKLFQNTIYAFKTSKLFTFSVIEQTFNPRLWAVFWVIVIFSTLAGLVYLRTKPIFALFWMLASTVLLICSFYFVVFTVPEIAPAVSFDRYLIEIVPAGILMLVEVYSQIKLKVEN